MPIYTIATVDAPGDLLPAANAGAPPGMTFAYHHVIAKNRLRDFWNAAANNDELKNANFTSFMTTLIEKTYERFPQGGSGGNVRTTLPAALQDSNGVGIVKGQMEALFDAVSNQRVLTTEQVPRWANEVIERMLIWAPGNLHKGPSLRINPNMPGWDQRWDDGGDNFEHAANLVLDQPTFGLLSAIEADMATYIGSHDSKTRLDCLKRIGASFPAVHAIQTVWPFDARQWYVDKANGDRWRLKAKPT
jgi:hypothetical protein